jgi:hypothetical protein
MPRAFGETTTAVAATTPNISLSINAMNALHNLAVARLGCYPRRIWLSTLPGV